MHSLDHHCVLALDVHNRLVGYAVFEGPENVLDYGVKRFRGGADATRIPLGIKIARLLAQWHPHSVVLKPGYRGRAAHNAKIIQAQALSFGAQVHFIPYHAIENVFPPLNNKYEKAHFLAGSLGPLTTRLPQKRKPWESEHYQLNVFEAAALGVAYFQRLGKLAAGSPSTDQ